MIQNQRSVSPLLPPLKARKTVVKEENLNPDWVYFIQIDKIEIEDPYFLNLDSC